MAETLVDCSNVEVGYGGTTVLGPISMRVERGDFWGVVGPNGAGKSTLLRILSGQLRPTSGSLQRDCGDPAYMLQHHNYSDDLPFRVRDVVGFGCVDTKTLGVVFGRNKRGLIDYALRELGLDGMKNRLYRELSGGEQRKVQFARLAVQGADLALLDEPTTGLDLDWQERVTRMAADLYIKRRRTIVMVTHDVDRLPQCCNKVMLLKNGRVLGTGSPSDIFRADLLSKLYGCAVEVVERDGRYHAFSTERTALGTEEV